MLRNSAAPRVVHCDKGIGQRTEPEISFRSLHHVRLHLAEHQAQKMAVEHNAHHRQRHRQGQHHIHQLPGRIPGAVPVPAAQILAGHHGAAGGHGRKDLNQQQVRPDPPEKCRSRPLRPRWRPSWYPPCPPSRPRIVPAPAAGSAYAAPAPVNTGRTSVFSLIHPPPVFAPALCAFSHGKARREMTKPSPTFVKLYQKLYAGIGREAAVDGQNSRR